MCEEYLSHPHKFFYVHVREIITFSEELLKFFGPQDDEKKKKYLKLLKYIALFHDLGKLTNENQERIKNKKRLAHEHSKYGEIIFSVFSQKFKILTDDEADIIKFVIKYHHSKFRNFDEKEDLKFTEIDKKRIKEIILVLGRVVERVKDLFSEEEVYYLSQFVSINESKSIDDSINHLIKYQKNPYIKPYGLNTFIDIIFLSSIFFISDRLSAQEEDENEVKKIIECLKEVFNKETYKSLNKKYVEYIEDLSHKSDNSEINKKRIECYNEIVKKFLEEFKKDKTTRVYKISLPTGIGKTYIGVRIALEIAGEYGIPIIYSLPFINIIEQTYERLKKIFGKRNVKSFHHIAFIENVYDENETSTVEDIINFKVSPILITTFVQIFHSIFAIERDFVLKFPLIVNSCIIIDEVQALDPQFYLSIEKIIEELSKVGFRIRIILMSATFPPIFSRREKDESLEIKIIDLTDKKLKEKYYSFFNRYKLVFHPDGIEIDKYKTLLAEKIFEREYANKNCIGIVCNKVEEAKQLFEFLTEYVSGLYKDGKIIRFGKNNSFKNKLSSYYKKVINRLREVKIEKKMLSYINDLSASLSNILDEIECVGYYSEKGKILIIYLAANLVDASKIERVHFLEKTMKKLKSSNFKFPINLNGNEINKIIVVSTQVIEAGVDFDFEIIFRSFAPFDSIVQTAGRANRNERWKEQGIVEIYKVKINDKFTYSPIYSEFLIEKTDKIISSRKTKEIFESEIFEISDFYLENILTYYKKDKAKEMVNILKSLRFEDIRKTFSIIGESGGFFRLILGFSSLFEGIRNIVNSMKDKEYKIKKIVKNSIRPIYLLQARCYLNNHQLKEMYKLFIEKKLIPFISIYEEETRSNQPLLIKKEESGISTFFVLDKNLYDSLTGISINKNVKDIFYII